MRERGCRGERQRVLGLRALLATGLVAAAAALGIASSALAARSTSGFHTQRVCGTPPPGSARCMAMRLVPSSPPAPGTAAASAAGAQGAGANPAVTYKHPFAGYLTPEELHAAYSLPTDTPASPLQTVAVVDAFDDPTAEADLAVYDEQFGLPPCTTANGCFRKVNQEGKASPLPHKQGEWATEISIDVQMAHAICQTCRILLVETKTEEFSDLGAGVNAAAGLGATEISNSYGGPEEPEFAGVFDEFNSDFYDHPGLVLTVSSGDCGYFNQSCPGEPATADFPSDSQYVVSVGGTSLTEAKGTWTSKVWDEGGSGCSELFTAQLWQTAAANFSATGCETQRSLADIAAIGDPNTGVNVYDSTPEFAGAATGWGVWGGTSVASPIVAAEYALAGGAHAVAYPAKTPYAHLGESSSLYDVVSGNNGSCGGSTACKAVAGYDGPTGVGSPVGLSAFSTPGAPVNTHVPTISGLAEQGQLLSETAGSWTASPSATARQWARCNSLGTGCAPIAGATAATYTVSAADVGSTIRVQETASNGAGSGAAAASTQTTPVPSTVPTLTGFTPGSGTTGSQVTIEGEGLGAVDEVKFGSLAATYKVLSSTKIQATVPNGARKASVSVSAPGGSASTKSKFEPTLSIISFKPLSGPPTAKPVTIKGVGFNAGSVVSFDGQAAATVFVSAKKLRATVPAGVKAGQISVSNTTAPVGTVFSAASYTP